MTTLIDPVIGMLVMLSGAVLFATAAIHKLLSIARFEAALDAYRVLPRWLVSIAARTLPLLELLCAGGMLVPAARSWAAAVAAGLLLAYCAAIAVNLRRGRRDIDCGCAGFGRTRPIHGWMIGRNSCIAALLLCAVAPASSRSLSWIDAVTVLGGSAVLSLLYVALEELFARGATGSRIPPQGTHS